MRQEALERQLADELVSTWGADTLAPFVLRADKSYFFGKDAGAFLAYRVVGVRRDRLGRSDRAARPSSTTLVASFVAFAHARDWRVAILGASERASSSTARHGLHALYHGDEAVVDTAAFSLEGRRDPQGAPVGPPARARRLRAARPAPERARTPSCGTSSRRSPTSGAAAQPERGFVMALDALFALGDDDAVFAVGFGPDGRAGGFLHFAVSRGGRRALAVVDAAAARRRRTASTSG